jgi:hypothetical protein
VNLSETALVLAQMQAYDQRTVGDSDVIAWHSLLVDAPFEDCQEAVPAALRGEHRPDHARPRAAPGA